MPSSEQVEANRRNSLKSTGPRTEEGKAASSQNSRTHGFSSKQFVIIPGQEEEFETFSGNLRENVQPEGALEDELFVQLLHSAWNLRRCRLAETELAANVTVDPLLDDTNEAKLRRIDLYARRAQAAFNRTLKELRVIQTERQYRVEHHPPEDFPVDEECMRGAPPLIDFTRLMRESTVKAKSDASPGDLFEKCAPPVGFLASLHRR